MFYKVAGVVKRNEKRKEGTEGGKCRKGKNEEWELTPATT